jgi:aerobic-type carbon monoxide dehydrogenase small subunit (CoxS/CutS family)
MDLQINGRKYTIDAQADDSLLSVLREQLDLTGSKYGCGEGACGACTVLVDGVAARSCIVKAGTLAGKSITTIEGLESNGQLHPVQKAFLKVDVFQCSYCASGMIMSAISLLQKNPKPDSNQIAKAMQGNVCRCGTHVRIAKAIEEAANV